MKRILFISSFFLFFSSSLFCQENDSTKTRISLSTNLVELPINEVGLYVDYAYNAKNSFGINFGHIYKNDVFYEFRMSGDQSTFPGTVWHGFVLRSDYKHFYAHEKRRFIQFQIIYKWIHYGHQGFMNDDSDMLIYFLRNENAYLFGFDLINGRQLLKYESHGNFELFWGIGYRHRVRNISELSTYYPPGPSKNIILNQNYPTIILGFKVGFNVFLKK